MLNSRDIDRLRPDVAANCRAWLELCRAAGLLVLVTGTCLLYTSDAADE